MGDDELEVAGVRALAGLRAAVDRAWLRAAEEVVGPAVAPPLPRAGCAVLGWLGLLVNGRVPLGETSTLRRRSAAAPVVSEAAKAQGLSKAQTAELARGHDLPVEVVGEAREEPRPNRRLGSWAGGGHPGAGPQFYEADTPFPSRCELVRRHDRVEVSATVDLVDGEVLEVALDSYARDGRASEGPPVRRAASSGPGRPRSPLARPRPKAPATTRIGRPHVVVVVDLEVLEARSGGVARARVWRADQR